MEAVRTGLLHNYNGPKVAITPRGVSEDYASLQQICCAEEIGRTNSMFGESWAGVDSDIVEMAVRV